MKSISDAIVAFLETYGQPQRYQVIADALAEGGYKNYSEEDCRVLVTDGRVMRVEDGVNAAGDPMVHYAPLGFDPNAESPNATAPLRY